MIRLVEHRVVEDQSGDAPPRDAPPPQAPPLTLVRQLLEQLHAESVRYCHWKSNQSLPAALAGTGDLDLLVDSTDAGKFQAIVLRLGFKLFSQPNWQSQTSVVHFYGHDESTGKLVHLHVYYRLVTGGHLLKNYRLPFERMLLEQSHTQCGVVVANRPAELAVLVVRKMLEAGGWIELALQWREKSHVDRELDWLLSGDSTQRDAVVDHACRLVDRYLPQLGPGCWKDGLTTLIARRFPLRQHLLGRRFRNRLNSFRLNDPIASALTVLTRLGHVLFNRVRRCSTKKTPAGGGCVIALVGPEASGKSTYCEFLRQWLSSAMTSQVVHLGKPSVSSLGCVANIARRVRRALRGWGRLSADPNASTESKRPSSAYALVSVILARDRYRQAMNAYRAAAQGAVVICDRYPARQPGTVDGPRLGDCAPHRLPRLVRWLARIESHYYQRIPPADLELQLSVPVSIAQRRNRDRVKADKEDDVYLAQRHRQFDVGRGELRSSDVIDTTAPMDEVLEELRKRVWASL